CAPRRTTENQGRTLLLAPPHGACGSRHHCSGNLGRTPICGRSAALTLAARRARLLFQRSRQAATPPWWTARSWPEADGGHPILSKRGRGAELSSPTPNRPSRIHSRRDQTARSIPTVAESAGDGSRSSAHITRDEADPPVPLNGFQTACTG